MPTSPEPKEREPLRTSDLPKRPPGWLETNKGSMRPLHGLEYIRCCLQQGTIRLGNAIQWSIHPSPCLD